MTMEEVDRQGTGILRLYPLDVFSGRLVEHVQSTSTTSTTIENPNKDATLWYNMIQDLVALSVVQSIKRSKLYEARSRSLNIFISLWVRSLCWLPPFLFLTNPTSFFARRLNGSDTKSPS